MHALAESSHPAFPILAIRSGISGPRSEPPAYTLQQPTHPLPNLFSPSNHARGRMPELSFPTPSSVRAYVNIPFFFSFPLFFSQAPYCLSGFPPRHVTTCVCVFPGTSARTILASSLSLPYTRLTCLRSNTSSFLASPSSYIVGDRSADA